LYVFEKFGSPEQMPFRHGRHRDPPIDRVFDLRWHWNRPHAPMFPDQIHDAPTIVALLNVPYRQIRQFGPAQPAS
jgi:hypothetical protein